jgi:predicted DNA-binding transcriptional regulator AlpA
VIGMDQLNIQKGGPETPCLAMRPREAAKALGISERLLWEWTRRGLVPHVKNGGVVVYPTDSLREWLRQCARTAEEKNSSQSAE